MGEKVKHMINDEDNVATWTQKKLEKEEKLVQLNKQINEQKKQINHIERSNTWRYAKPLRFFSTKLATLFRRHDIRKKEMRIKELEKELFETKEQLLQVNEQLHQVRLQDFDVNKYEIQQWMRTLKEDGQLLANLERFTEQKVNMQHNYREALTYIARLYMQEEDTYKKELYEKIFASLHVEEIPEFMIRSGLTDSPLPLRDASTFRGSLSMRMRQKQLDDTLPEWELDDKRKAYQFVQKFGIRTPELDERHYTIATIPERTEIAVKPHDAAGARGVYLIHDVDNIFDVRNSTKLPDWKTLRTCMEQDLATGQVATDDWIIEELIYENKAMKLPARDVKFYSFYGKIGLILEIVRDPEIRHCWWTGEGERITTGKYDESLFIGNGVTKEEIKMVEHVSAQIPAPFIRIDFLRSEDGLVFGEFTPKPGDYDDFDNEIDQVLGDYFLEAQGRLTNDLLNGKEFTYYKQFINETKEVIA